MNSAQAISALPLNIDNLSVAEQLADPSPSLLGKLLQSRLAIEAKGDLDAPLPQGVNQNLRPDLPKIGPAALALFMNRRAVQSYPLLFTTLAVAHPN